MPNLPISQLPLASSGQPESWMAIVNYDADPSGITNKIYFSSLTEQFSGSSGTSGTSGIDGTSGSSGSSGTSGTDGTSGSSGSSGTSGTDGTSGSSGSSGTSGNDGTSGSSGSSGTSGNDGTSGSSGSSGTSGTSGTSAPTPPYPFVYGLFAQTGNSATVSGTTSESTLIDGGVGTLSVPASGFSVGDSFRVDMAGVFDVGNNQTIRIRVKTGSVILADSGAQAITNITDDVWGLSINFTIRQVGVAGVASIVSLGAFHYTKTSNGAVEGFSFNTVNNTTFDTTVNNTLDITVQWGSTSVDNSIYSDIFVLNKIY